jgi:cytochrome c553
MPKHIFRLTLVIVGFAVVAYAAKQFFTVDSFYRWGHYRGNSVAQIAADKPKFHTPKYCEQCHAAQYGEWSKGVHYNPDQGKVVKCEVCHGAAGTRDENPNRYIEGTTGKEHPNGVKMIVPTETAKLCTLCHEQMTARPAAQKQIVVATHAGTQQCTTCHNPHSPRTFKVAAAAPPKGNAAAGKAAAAVCAGCHGDAGVGGNVPGPALAGQKAGYLVEAIKAYKTGARSDPMMSGIVKDMGDADIENVAAYFAGSKCKSAQNGDKKAATAGQAVAARCAACHGAKGISTQPAWPNLAGQSKDYLAKVLQAYKSGNRKNGMMDGIAKDLSDADAANVAAYFSNSACR